MPSSGSMALRGAGVHAPSTLTSTTSTTSSIIDIPDPTAVELHTATTDTPQARRTTHSISVKSTVFDRLSRPPRSLQWWSKYLEVRNPISHCSFRGSPSLLTQVDNFVCSSGRFCADQARPRPPALVSACSTSSIFQLVSDPLELSSMIAPTIPEQPDIDGNISALEKSEEEIVELKRERNELSPVSRIPAEILCEILLLATIRTSTGLYPDDPSRHREERCMEVLCNVCHSWRTAALACPQLWVDIDVRGMSKAEHVEFFVNHAHPLPLSVYIDGTTEGSIERSPEKTQLTGCDAIQRILSESKAKFTLLMLVGTYKLIMNYLGMLPEATEIRAIHVFNTDFGVSGRMMVIPQCGLTTSKRPNLHDFTLLGCGISLTSPILFQANLTSLALAVPLANTAPQLFNLLRNTSQLRALQLYFNNHGFSSHPPIVNPLVAVNLPHLEILLLKGGSATILLILENLVLPSVVIYFEISCYVPLGEPSRNIVEKLYEAIGKSRRVSVQTWLDRGQPFSPKILSIIGSSPKGRHRIGAYYWEKAPSNNFPPCRSSTSVEVEVYTGRTGAIRRGNDKDWLPMFVCHRPEDLARSTGWSLSELTALKLVDLYDSHLPSSVWNLMSASPNLQDLYIEVPHFFEFLPSLCARHDDQISGSRSISLSLAFASD
ncbi:hypothetical protein NMY22_g7688 [Coprinellus aureogranulatus]|nr:hypothetical protein NMY22_g7688 [Coprinellus aureogranulatus]